MPPGCRFTVRLEAGDQVVQQRHVIAPGVGLHLAGERRVGIDLEPDGVVAFFQGFDEGGADPGEGIEDAHLAALPDGVEHPGDKGAGESGNPRHPAMQGNLVIFREGGIAETWRGWQLVLRV